MKKLFLILTIILSSVLCLTFTGGSQKTLAENSGNVYDISEVSSIAPGGELEFYGQLLMVGNKQLENKDSVKFLYKIANLEKYVRSAFGIGCYGFYFSYDVGKPISVKKCDFNGSKWGRAEEVFSETETTSFSDYIEMTLKIEETAENKITLSLSYEIGGKQRSVSAEFDKAESDMKLRFGENADQQYSEVYIKSLLPAATFGDGSFKYVNYNNNAGKNISGKCMLGTVGTSDAEKFGVPSGYNENVLKIEGLTPTGSLDMSFDFSAANIKRERVKSISFRIYVTATSSDTDKYPVLRVPNYGSTSAFTAYPVGNNTNKWLDVSFNENQIDNICSAGKLTKFTLWFRTNARTIIYIDSFKVDLIPLDETPPVISAPITEFNLTAGVYPLDDSVTATDDSGEVSLQRIWSDGALDNRGRLTAGTHTCKVIASDPSGNTSEVALHYNVTKEADLEKYSITFRFEGIDEVTVEYYKGGEDYVTIPSVPERKHYDFVTDEIVFNYTANQVVNGYYVATVYKVNYYVDGALYTSVSYTVENIYNFAEPDVPAKKGCRGQWEDYLLNYENVNVNAVYTPKETSSESEKETPSESESKSENETESKSEIPGTESAGSASDNNTPGATESGKTENKGCGSAANATPIALLVVLFSSLAAVMIKRKQS